MGFWMSHKTEKERILRVDIEKAFHLVAKLAKVAQKRTKTARVLYVALWIMMRDMEEDFGFSMPPETVQALESLRSQLRGEGE
jgi:hypothetical protein